MGEKMGTMFLMVTVVVVAVALLLIFQVALPDLGESIVSEMTSIVDGSFGGYSAP